MSWHLYSLLTCVWQCRKYISCTPLWGFTFPIGGCVLLRFWPCLSLVFVAIQCDEKCSHYSPCVQTCPKQTCDNYIIHSNLNQLCSEDACVEGGLQFIVYLRYLLWQIFILFIGNRFLFLLQCSLTLQMFGLQNFVLAEIMTVELNKLVMTVTSPTCIW